LYESIGGVGAGGIPGRSYAFAPSADGTHKQFYCGHRFVNGRWLIYPKKDKDGFTVIAKYPDNIKFTIFFSHFYDFTNNFTFHTYAKISKGATYKLKGTGIKETIFTVEELNVRLTNSNIFNVYNVKFTDPNINSGQLYYYTNNDPLFELSVKN